MDSSFCASTLMPSPRLTTTSTAHVKQHTTDGKGDGTIRSPLNLAGHEAAGQYVQALENPNDANERQEYAEDSASNFHGNAPGVNEVA